MKKKVHFITPSLTAGGAERVISELAIYFAAKPDVKVTVICLTQEEQFYRLPGTIKVVTPPFNHKNYSRLVFTYKIYRYLRNYLKNNRPAVQLSFGGKYNSFVLLAAMGLGIKTFISDRSRPTISYGKILDKLNAVVYKKAAGIIAQTGKAKTEAEKKTGHKNIRIIGNPIRMVKQNPTIQKENIIVNAGRFIKSKHQPLLAEYFAKANNGTWKLLFLGSGEYFAATQEKVKQLRIEEFVEFAGTVQDIDSYYSKSKIFAFTSTSEGFPNVLGEALSAPLACISFDCLAGPADLIEDGKNGFLVPEMDHETYVDRLKQLMYDDTLREAMAAEAAVRIQKFSMENIGKQYYEFMMEGSK